MDGTIDCMQYTGVLDFLIEYYKCTKPDTSQEYLKMKANSKCIYCETRQRQA